MLQTELTSNNAALNIIAKTENQADIVRKIQELNKWQEERKKQLEVKQTLQRQMLGIEQQNMYQMLGLQSQSELSIVEEIEKDGVVERVAAKNGVQFLEFCDESTEENSQLDEDEEVDDEEHMEMEPISCRTLTSGYDTEDLTQMKPKRKFLRRGEGLKQRFKIDPDELRLNNLPKYKYANAHPRLRLKPFNKHIKTKDLKTKTSNQETAKTAGINPSNILTASDAQEQRFQKLLIASKNSLSSTPDTKSTIVTSKGLAATAKTTSSSAEKFNFDAQNVNLTPKLREMQRSDEFNNQSAVTKTVAWSKILDPLEITPLQVPRKSIQTLPETEESIFELLEKKAEDGSFDMDSTCLKEFMTRRITEKLNETNDDIPVTELIKNKRLEPVVLSENLQEPSYCSSDEAEEEESQLTEYVESTESFETTHKTIETTNSSYPQHSQVRVRFSDSNETHEYDEEPETTLNDSSRLSAGSEHNEGQGDSCNNQMFQQFKQALFAALQVKADQYLANDTTNNSVSDTTLTPKDSTIITKNYENNNSHYSPACKELQEKTDMIKIRLADLEKEIQYFKDNNVVLMKARQEHELQKSLNAQEHLEAMESIKDEKIRMEIYLHDERVKLEDEKRQFEQNMKMKTQGLIAKERKECERLKEQAAQLEMQLKSKENNHTAAQARLRTQIRNLEREQSKLHEQIENLTRENKRLENENIKISREQNNKILLEINRNLAKLAPKQIQNSSNAIPDEGPPTLGSSRTVSNCIVATATANKNTATSIRFANGNPATNKKYTSQRYTEAETPREKYVVEENQQQQQQTIYITDNDEENDEDILREFQATPDNLSTSRAAKRKSPHKQSPKTQNHIPGPPPSSPRSSGGCSNNNMKREIVNTDGSKDIWYPNGNLKKISADGMIIRMLYYNRDIKETNINEGTVKYYYAETNTWHTTYLDGLEILEFPNGQVEHRHKSGLVEVHYPNNSIKIIDPKDIHKQEEWRFHDGTHCVQMRNGDKILSLPNGQKEIHTKLQKRREYPDGTVKIVYPDGSTETRYSNGRIRLKDKEGNLVMDTDMAK